MIPCPACRSPSRQGRCPFCGTAIAWVASTLLATPALAEPPPLADIYGAPDTFGTEEPVVVPAPMTPEMRASAGQLTDEEVSALTAKSSTDLAAATLLADHGLAKGDVDVAAPALLAMSKLDPKNPSPLYRLTMLRAAEGNDALTLTRATAAVDQLPLWDPDQRLKREISLRKIIATCQQRVTPDSQEAIDAAKAYVKVAIEGHVRVPDALRALSQKKLP